MKVKATEFIKAAHVIGMVHALEGGVIYLDDLLVDFIRYLKQEKKPTDKLQKDLALEYLSRCDQKIMAPHTSINDMVELLVNFLDYAGGQLTFVKTAYTEQTGGGVMNDQLHLANGKLLVISDDLVCLYENEEQYNTGDLPAPQTIYLYETPKAKEPKPDMYLLFGKEVCEAMAEYRSFNIIDDSEPMQEVLDLINDGAEYCIMKTDGTNLPAILSELEDKGGYCFVTLDEYTKILDI